MKAEILFGNHWDRDYKLFYIIPSLSVSYDTQWDMQTLSVYLEWGFWQITLDVTL